MYSLVFITAMLSVSFVFVLPQPIRPHTSIGLIGGISLFSLAFLMVQKEKRKEFFSVTAWKHIDYLVVLYVVAVLLSLIFTTTIQDTTPIKLLFSGVIMYFLSNTLRPTEMQKRVLIHVFGVLAVGIASLGVLQVIVPNIMNPLAEKFLRGSNAYGITIEFERGRLLHWGSLIFIFTFFYTSALLLHWNKRIWTTLYVLYGFVVICFVMVMGNFRWTFLVFAVVSFLYGLAVYRIRLLSPKRVFYIVATSIVMIMIGMFFARMIFGYNLLDRFLFKDGHRDFVESMGRVTLYNQALTVFQSYPLFGAGYGNYYFVVWPFPHMKYYSIFDQYEPTPVPIAAHNEFYTVLAETGILGLFSYILLIYFIGKRLYVLIHRRLQPIDMLLAVSLGTSYLAIILYVLFENMYPQNIIYVLLMGSIAYRWIIVKQNES